MFKRNRLQLVRAEAKVLKSGTAARTAVVLAEFEKKISAKAIQ